MDVFTELMKYMVFTINNMKNLQKMRRRLSSIKPLNEKDLIKKIRKIIYSVVNLATGQMVANRYQIACAITNTASISHHSNFEYYGLENQEFNFN